MIMTRSSGLATLAISVVALITGSCDSRSAREATDVLVAVVEPRAGGPDQRGLSYSVTLTASKLNDAASIMDGFSAARTRQLAIFLSGDVSVGVVPSLVSMASKTIRDVEIRLFIISDDRSGMMPMPGFKWVGFSTDPVIVGKYFE